MAQAEASETAPLLTPGASGAPQAQEDVAAPEAAPADTAPATDPAVASKPTGMERCASFLTQNGAIVLYSYVGFEGLQIVQGCLKVGNNNNCME